MIYFEFSLDMPFKYNLTGKFKAPSVEWKHFSRFMEDYELIIVTKGYVYIQVNEQRFDLKEGEYLILPPSSKQSGYKNSDCEFYWLHFTIRNQADAIIHDEYPEILFSNKICIPQYGKLKNLEKVVVVMKHLQDCVRCYHNNLQNDYMCTSILCEISSQILLDMNHATYDLKLKQLYSDIQDYIKWNINSDIKVSEIAEHFGYNKRYISHLFSTISGVPLKQYIVQEKIESAKYLLCDTNDNVNEIAYQLGFNDSHNFMKVFKRIVGLTPTQYRNSYASRLLFYK